MRIGCRGNEVVRGARHRLAWLVGLTIAVAPPALAQSSDTMASIAIPAQPGAIVLLVSHRASARAVADRVVHVGLGVTT